MFGLCAAIWLLWGIVFYLYFRNSTQVMTRAVSWLLKGSVLELLIAVPCSRNCAAARRLLGARGNELRHCDGDCGNAAGVRAECSAAVIRSGLDAYAARPVEIENSWRETCAARTAGRVSQIRLDTLELWRIPRRWQRKLLPALPPAKTIHVWEAGGATSAEALTAWVSARLAAHERCAGASCWP